MNEPIFFRRAGAVLPLWILAVLLLTAATTRAREPEPKHRRMENRFLFVIDTSSSMRSRAGGVEEAVNGLMRSGMYGELRKGDTIGLWTYNDHLDTHFPMQTWSDVTKDEVAKEVDEYVSHLNYEKRAHLDKALPDIRRVVASSERLTVILIFNGSDDIKGTPFDKDINGLHKRYASEFRAAREPFVTLLAARNGAVFDYTINYPSKVMVPHMADPLPPPETNAPPVAVSAPPPAEPAPLPLEVATTPHTNVQIILTGADFAPKTTAPPPTATNSVAVATPAPLPAPAVVENVSSPAGPAPAPIPVPSSAKDVVDNSASPASSVPPQVTPSAAVSTPPPAPMAKRPTQPEPAATTPAPPSSASAPPAPVHPAAGMVASVVPPGAATTTGELTAMFIMAFSLLTIAVVLVLFLLRRWRGGSQPSLISQSIDRSR